MTTTTTLTLGQHLALLDPLYGNGFLVLPHPDTDCELMEGEPTLHHADLMAALVTLDGLGWEPSDSDDGGLSVDGYTASGRPVVGLYGRSPVHPDVSFDHHLEAAQSVFRDACAIV